MAQVEVSTGPHYVHTDCNSVKDNGTENTPFKVNGWETREEVNRTMFTPFFENVNYLNFGLVIANLKSLELKNSQTWPRREDAGGYFMKLRQIAIFSKIAKWILPDQLNYLPFLELLVDWFMANILTTRQVLNCLMGLRYITICLGKMRYQLEEELVFLVLGEISGYQAEDWFFKTLWKLWQIESGEMKHIHHRINRITFHTCDCEMHSSFPIPGPHRIPQFENLHQAICRITGSVQNSQHSALEHMEDVEMKASFDYRFAQKTAYKMAMFNWDIPMCEHHTLREEEITDSFLDTTKLPGFDFRSKAYIKSLLVKHHPDWRSKKIQDSLDWLSDLKVRHCPCRYHLTLRKEWEPEAITFPMKWSLVEKATIAVSGPYQHGLYWLKKETLCKGFDSYEDEYWESYNWAEYARKMRTETIDCILEVTKRTAESMPALQALLKEGKVYPKEQTESAEGKSDSPYMPGLNPLAESYVPRAKKNLSSDTLTQIGGVKIFELEETGQESWHTTPSTAQSCSIEEVD